MTKHSAFTTFIAIFLADFAVRTAYMTGKSPVLPVFADELGANQILLGAIVSVSTLTGLLSKPLFGFLSDRQGKWIWLCIGTVLFCATPLLYLGVTTTSELVVLRLVHGLATAIYGPVTLAFIAGLGTRPQAEWFGWFSLARTGGYVLGPVIGGALLGVVSPAQVYALTSLISLVAFVPLMMIRSVPEHTPSQDRLRDALPKLALATLRNKPLAIFGLVEMSSRMGVYAVKTFLPLMILAKGGTALEAGIFLSVQEAAAAVLRPIAGRIADRLRAQEAVAVAGLFCMSIALAMLPLAVSADRLLMAALMIGAGNGIYLPAAYSLIARAAGADGSGTAFGVVGALRNAGKLLGPIAGGALLYAFSVQHAFLALAILPLFAGYLLVRRGATRRAKQPAFVAYQSGSSSQ